MNEQPSVSFSNQPAGVMGWFAVWKDAVTKPNEQTYIDIAASPNAKFPTALLWVFIGSLVNFFVTYLVQGSVMRNMMQSYGLEGGARGGVGFSLVSAICGAPVAAVVSVVLFVAFTGVVQWIAKMFGGQGDFEKLVYVFAAIATPFTFVSAVLSLLGAIPYVGACFGIITLGLSLYVLVLQVMAVKGVNRLDWGKAAGALLLPGFVIFCCVLVVMVGVFGAMGAAFGDVFHQINQGLIP